MATFPVLNNDSLTIFLKQYSLGDDCRISVSYSARSHHTCRFQLNVPHTGQSAPDTENIENFLLLAVEPGAHEHLTFITSLVEYLYHHNIPVTPCIKTNQQTLISSYHRYPVTLFRLPRHYDQIQPNKKICQQIGTFLGKMHSKSSNFPSVYGNPRSLVWLNLAAEELLPKLSAGDAALLKEQLNRFKTIVDNHPNLPCGPLIGSLFKDQLFFQDNNLQAVTGFYFSCTDWLLLDVAQAVNAWCCNDSGELDKQLTTTLLAAYHAERPFIPSEHQYWQDILCFATTRFWVSRLLTTLIPEKVGYPSIVNSAEECKQKLRCRITGYYPLPD